MGERQRYTTDVTDEEWMLWEQALGPEVRPPNFAPPKYARREVLNAILYRLRTGCQWRNLPHDFPPWKDVYYHFSRWKQRRVFARAQIVFGQAARRAAGREESPSLVLADSQSVRSTEAGGERGFDAGKKVKGRKRHLLTDVLGIVLAVLVTAASVQDRDGFERLCVDTRWRWPRLKKVLVDSAYNGEPVERVMQRGGIQVEITRPPEGSKGFVVVAKRWAVERTFGWLNRERLLSKSYEKLVSTEEAWVYLASSRRLVRGLALGGTG